MKQHSAAFHPILEVPPAGALVKVAYAGAFLRPQARSSTSEARRASRRTRADSFSSRLFPDTELSGFVEALGEDVEGKTDVAVGDRVIVCPSKIKMSSYCDVVSVSDVSWLVSVPSAVPLDTAATIPTGAVYVVDAVRKAIDHCCALLNHDDVSQAKMMLVGNVSLLSWALRIVSHLTASWDNKIRVVAITDNDEAILTWSSQFPSVSVVQWNGDAYEAVLLDRTRDACGGDAHAVVLLGASHKFITRAMSCACKGAKVLLAQNKSKGSVNVESLMKENNTLDVQWLKKGNVNSVNELLSLVATTGLQVPPFRVCGQKDMPAVESLMMSGGLQEHVVFDMAAREE